MSAILTILDNTQLRGWTYPPNAPASVALQRNNAIRVARSSALYQKLMKKTIPGKIPASKAPRKNRSADVLAKLFAPAMAVQKAPKPITKKPSQLFRRNVVLADKKLHGI